MAMKKNWKIGELAAETGLTVRTLHYYDELGLLKPRQETSGGHRLYVRSDLERLQKILTLKQLGFPLDKIKDAIDQPDFSLKEATTKLRSDLQKRKTELDEIENRLKDAEKFQPDNDVTTDSVLQLLSRLCLLDKHLTQEQLASIKEHDSKFGPEKLNELRGEWVTATEDLQRAINTKLSPSDWRTKAICMRWFGLACAFMGGSLERVYDLKKISDAEPNAEMQLGIPGADLKSLFEFVELVLAESGKYATPRALAYAQVGVSDLDKARKFYDRILAPLEMKPIFHHPNEVVYGKTNPEFFIGTKTHDGKPVQLGNGFYVGFWASSTEEVDAIYRQAIEAGGSSIRAPGLDGSHLYTSYIRDPDGNALEIMKWFDDPNKPTG